MLAIGGEVKMETLPELQAKVTDMTVDYIASVGDVVAELRPAVQQNLLEVAGNPTAVDEPARYYDTMRIAEEAIRRPILRGLGHIMVEPFIAATISNTEYGGSAAVASRKVHPPVFIAELSRGRVHNYERGKFARFADRRLRALASTTFCSLYMAPAKQQNLHKTFWDVSQRVREFAWQTLDYRLGEDWRTLDPDATALVQVDELNGRKISRYDRRLPLAARKPLDVHESFSNATATAAEFTAISLQGIQRALEKAGCSPGDWYAHAFAHLNKLSFGAKLPFWTAQDLAIAANDSNPDPIFTAERQSSYDYYSVEYTRASLKKYLDKNNRGECQGAVPPESTSLTPDEIHIRENFVDHVRKMATRTGTLANYVDVPEAHKVTSADVATAYALSIAYSYGYNLVR